MMAILVQQSARVALDGKEKKPTMMKDYEEEADQKALSIIKLCITDDVLQQVLSKKMMYSLWNKFESLYMVKTVAYHLGVL